MTGDAPPLAGLQGHEAIEPYDPVHRWRVSRLARLGIPPPVAEAVAGHVDWHQVAALVQ